MLIPAQSAPAPPFSSLRSLSSHYILLPSHFLPPGGGVLPRLRRGDLAIRMGGGPRTYPGGVSKWQWKRMQAKKARQLLKARLARERQLYEMRKRAELRDAVAHLERPWDPDSSADGSASASAVAPNLLSVAAEDQLRALADRFHRPGGVDLWNDRDGPRVFASPATGAASARFFPRNAFHSVQPYALVSAGGEARAQGVRENATEDEVYSSVDDHQPAVELTETDDGTWEPVNGLGDADDSIAGDWTSDDDDDNDKDYISESEGMGDIGSWREQRAMVARNGKGNSVARWEAAGAMAAASDNDRGWIGDAFSSDSERAREGHREQRWQERSTNTSPRKQASGRWTGMKTTAGSHGRQRGRTGAGSFSESEVIRGGSEPKWRANKGKRDDARSGAGRWNTPRKDWIGDDGFDSESDSARGRELEPRRGARNKMNGSGSLRGRSKSNYSANANAGEKLLKYLGGDQLANSSNGFAEDLKAPKWKPRRMNRARNNNGGRDDDMGGRFRRGVGVDGAAGRLQANPMNDRRDGREDGVRKTSRNGGRRHLWGDEYSLRPTSEQHSSWRDTGSDGL